MEKQEDFKDVTLLCDNLGPNVDEKLLYELFLQVAPVKSVQQPENFRPHRALVVLKHSISVPYAIDMLNGIELYGRRMHVRKFVMDDAASYPYRDQYNDRRGKQQNEHQFRDHSRDRHRYNDERHTNMDRHDRQHYGRQDRERHRFDPMRQEYGDGRERRRPDDYRDGSHDRQNWQQPANRNYQHHNRNNRNYRRKY